MAHCRAVAGEVKKTGRAPNRVNPAVAAPHFLLGHAGCFRHLPGSNLDPSPRMEYFTKIPRHAFVLTDECLFTDPPFTKARVWQYKVLHYVDEYADPYPEFAKKALLAVGAILAGCSVFFLGALIVLFMPHAQR